MCESKQLNKINESGEVNKDETVLIGKINWKCLREREREREKERKREREFVCKRERKREIE